MEYLYVLSLIAHHPTCLFILPTHRPASIGDLVDERKAILRLYACAYDEWTDYSLCRKRLLSRVIDASLCHHSDTLVDSHTDRLAEIDHTMAIQRQAIDRLGRKIERRMRKLLQL